MPDLFPILELRFDSPETEEQLGSKLKFWFRVDGDAQPWLFKFTREGTGEDWSEKVASEIATLLKVPAATVELATFMGKRGCASRSFVETHAGFDLIHGSEVLAGRVLGYDKRKQWQQSNHCIENILKVVEEAFPVSQRSQQLSTLAGFIVLDALICNIDRHHDNWGLLRGPSQEGKSVHRVAPSFDHASSLGRELQDERRTRILSENRIANYIRKGRGGIYWKPTDAKGENPLVLAEKAAVQYSRYFRSWLETVHSLKTTDFDSVLARVPLEYMSLEAKRFCGTLLSVTVEQLKAISR